MRRNIFSLLVTSAAIGGGIAYPLLVYFGLAYVPAGALIAFALGLLALRMLVARRQPIHRQWMRPLLVAALGLASLAIINPQAAVKAYPVLISLAAASVFGASLLSPPTLIERFARIGNPDLPSDAIAYTRSLTLVWTIFLVGNAAIAAAVGLWGSPEQWTLWNGLISYLLMGTLFFGEWVVRRLVRRGA